MKKCIWCNKTEETTSFNKLAHSIPKSLGGKSICKNVCDDCNSYFGNANQGHPSVEVIIKEAFNISRARFLDAGNDIGKNKALARFKSIYFDVDFKKRSFKLKSSYKYTPFFQEKISRQLKKGIYKMFLEETEIQNADAHDEKYDFIREFCRYNLGDYPVYYFERKNGIFFISSNFLESPDLFLKKQFRYKYLIEEPGFYEFDLLGHTFGIATTKNWNLVIDNYLRKTAQNKKDLFKGYKQINKFNDIDLALSILDNKT